MQLLNKFEHLFALTCMSVSWSSSMCRRANMVYQPIVSRMSVGLLAVLPVMVGLLDCMESRTEASIERPSRMHPCRHVLNLGGFDWWPDVCCDHLNLAGKICLLWCLGVSGLAGQVVEALGARLTTVGFRDEVEKSMKCLGVKGCPATIYYTISCSISFYFFYVMCGLRDTSQTPSTSHNHISRTKQRCRVVALGNGDKGCVATLAGDKKEAKWSPGEIARWKMGWVDGAKHLKVQCYLPIFAVHATYLHIYVLRMYKP